MAHPHKLKDDAIVEALCEIRFSFPEEDVAEEVVVGRLIDSKPWSADELQRLPISDFPGPLRRGDENLRFQPSVQLRSKDGNRLVRFGPNVASLHIVNRYCGWAEFEPQLHDLIAAVVDRVPGFQADRVGLRYLNVLSAERHYINSIYDLSFSVMLGQEELRDPVNLNFMRQPAEDIVVMTRVASPQFTKGKLPQDATAIVDIDVHTTTGFGTRDKETLVDWVRRAHDFEKDAFFGLLPDAAIKNLEEG